jgi:hypothetical protein
MSARRRDNTPPYEIMGKQPVQPQASGRGPRPGGGIGGFGRSLVDAWRDGASEPLLLRVPRGMALCLLAGLLGLLILAYWVGYSRGGAAAEQRVMAIYEPSLNGAVRVPPTRPGGASQGPKTAFSGTSGQGSAQSSAGQRADPRTPGLNYLILATCAEDEAQRLKKFLTDRQVDVMIGPRNNRGLCQVIVLKGITPQQYGDQNVRERILAPMRALGRDWKAFNKGKGDNLSSMFYEKYKPDD